MITLLSSGVTLGTYVPAKVLAARLARAGVPSSVEVFESLLGAAEARRDQAAAAVFRNDFKVAVTALRLVRDQTPRLDQERVSELQRRWAAERRARFVVFSGFWQPVVARYAQAAAWPVQVDVCHLDAAATPSFRLLESPPAGWRQVWMFDAETDRIPCTIPITDDEPLPWSQRERRVLAHGGGWGLGDYRDRAAELAARGLGVDLIVHDLADVDQSRRGVRHFMIDPAWVPWTDGGFPPFCRISGPAGGPYARRRDHHDSFELARRAVAMICKTGGGTLLDSLWSATPIIALEPFGAHEAVNAQLWGRLGFGLSFAAWRDGGFRFHELEPMHRRLIQARGGVLDYSGELAARAGEAAGTGAER
jgi:hypothetical protein